MEKKLQKFTEHNDKSLKETESRITNNLDSKMDTRMTNFSNTVATQVASQIMEMMNQYMTVAARNRQLQNMAGEAQMITQDNTITSPRKGTEKLQLITAAQDEGANHTTFQMLQALEDINMSNTTPTPSRSTHDINIERSMDEEWKGING